MRILMTTDCVGGVWSYATTLSDALVERGIDVTLAVTGGPLSLAQRRQASRVDLRHRPLKCEWMQPPLEDVAEAGAWLAGLAKDLKPDLVHLNDFAHGKRDFGTAAKVVVAHSDVYSWHAAVQGQSPGEAWEPYRVAVLAGLKGADAVVAPTQAVLDGMTAALGKFNAASGVVIPNAVAEFEASADREPFILTAGRVWDEAKNVKLLAEAAASVSWPVKVAGDASHPDGGAAAFEQVELLGPMPNAKLRALMASAGLYVLPAKYEPFGLSAVEAGLAGCPLVLGDIASLRDVWGDAATFVPTDDAEVLGQTLQRLIASDDERQRLGQAARERAQTFTVERQVTSYLELYRKLVQAA